MSMLSLGLPLPPGSRSSFTSSAQSQSGRVPTHQSHRWRDAPGYCTFNAQPEYAGSNAASETAATTRPHAAIGQITPTSAIDHQPRPRSGQDRRPVLPFSYRVAFLAHLAD
jgi:hypothetical protein